jgi:hypothetical protein
VARTPEVEPDEGAGESDRDADRIERVGVAPRVGPIHRDTAEGWAGERLFGNGNDWEPATAADPTAPYVYMVTTRYSGPGPLPCKRCDLPAIALKVSSDGGATFGKVQYMPVDVPGGQYDPQIATDGLGNVYAAWIDGNFHDVFSKSTDHGQTWSDPVTISSPAGWADHPWLGVSQSGQHVYVGFNHAASWVAQSHDGGQTWLPAVQTSHVDRYFYANGDVVGDDGSVVISQMSYRLDSGDTGPIKLVVTWSVDGGKTFQTTTIDTVAQQPRCRNEGCPHDHYGAHAALAGDADGHLLLVYDGAVEPKGAQLIWSRMSTDGGATWSDPIRISPGGPDLIATEPAVVATGTCDIRLIYMDDRNGIERWNTWFRSSTDCGATWSPDVRISDAKSGTGYTFARGFAADYGDYDEVAVTSTGETFAVWGAGYSYRGPGGTWYNRTV